MIKCSGIYTTPRGGVACDSFIGCGKQHCPVMSNNGITRIMKDVKAFHVAVEQPVLDKPTIPSDERVKLRTDLIMEEAVETLGALGAGIPISEYERRFVADSSERCSYDRSRVDLVKLADGLADLIYVCVGTALEFGIPLDKVWAEVQRSNMDKVRGGIRRRDDGKILKPVDWAAPDIEGCLK